jgi:hypothetical protein
MKLFRRVAILVVLSGATWLAQSAPAYADCIQDCVNQQQVCTFNCDNVWPCPPYCSMQDSCRGSCDDQENRCLGNCGG